VRKVLFHLRHAVPLAPYTTLGLGGAARFFSEIVDAQALRAALRWAGEQQLPVFILGGGSNLVVADQGFPGLVLRMGLRGQAWASDGDDVVVEAQAGEPWDDIVTEAVQRRAAGIECLAGIPGTMGAAPVQNIGAYGREVSEVIRGVRVLDRRTLEMADLTAAQCAFSYRDSLFKRDPAAFVIVSVTLALGKGPAGVIRYAELASAFAGTRRPDLVSIRDAVLALRRKKSMVLDQSDPNHRSAGSFFTNPIVSTQAADRLAAHAVSAGAASSASAMPRFPLPDGQVKLAAGWLIERAGLGKGFRMGPVGISSQHALALVHYGKGSTADLLRLALHVRKTVHDCFGITLVPEPVFLGMTWPS
jgi:UDP-N-acetylmuramate dehydrogenase